MPEIVEQLLAEYRELAGQDAAVTEVEWDSYVRKAADMAGSLVTMLASEILRCALAEQLLLPALTVLKRLRRLSYELQSVWIDSDALLTGYLSYREGDRAAAVAELESGRQDLDAFGLCLLGDNYSGLNDRESAMECYADALDMCHEPKLTVSILWNMAGGYLAVQQWDEAEQTYRRAAEIILGEEKTRSNVDYYAWCVFNSGYAGKRRELACGDAFASIGIEFYDTSMMHSVDCWFDYLEGDHILEDFLSSGLHTLWLVAGMAAAFDDHMAQAAGDTPQTGTKRREPIEAPALAAVVKQMGDLVDRLGELSDRLRAHEDGGQPYAREMLKRFPGLSEQASWHLGWAEYEWQSEPRGCPTQSILFSLGIAAEITLKQGLLASMYRYAVARAEAPFLTAGDTDLCIGVKYGRDSTPDRITLGQTALFFKQPVGTGVMDFIEDACQGDLRMWLANDAYSVLKHLADLRNRTAHAEPVSREEVAEMRSLLFDQGLLQRLLDLGANHDTQR